MHDTYAEIRTHVLDRVGMSTSDTTDDFYATVQRAIDRVYNDLSNYRPWLWTRAYPPGVFRTTDDITTGTVNVTLDSTSITFSAAPAASVANREIVITGRAEVYRISTHVAGAAAAVLDSAYNFASNATASYTVFQRDYQLASDLNHIEALVVSDGKIPIPQREEGWLRAHRPDPPSAQWPPEFFARIDQTRIRLSGYPDRTRRVEYPYTVTQQTDISDGSTTILVPRQWRYVLVDGAIYEVLVARNDDRADGAGILYAAGRELMVEADARNRRVLGQYGHREVGAYA